MISRQNRLTRQRNRIRQRELAVLQHSSKPRWLYDIGVGPPPKHEAKTLCAAVPGLRVIGCEPTQTVYQSLLEQHYPGELLNLAVSTAPSVHLREFADSALNTVKADTNGDQRALRVVETQAVTLDWLDAHVGKPDGIILWADVEGSELDVLQSGQSLLRSGRLRAINLEFTTVEGKLPGAPLAAELHAYVTSLGYCLRQQVTEGGDHHDRIYVWGGR